MFLGLEQLGHNEKSQNATNKIKKRALSSVRLIFSAALLRPAEIAWERGHR